METINGHEAKTHLSRLLERVHKGEEIVLSKAGKPYARLVPLKSCNRQLGFIEGHLDESFFDPLPEDELNAWNGK